MAVDGRAGAGEGPKEWGGVLGRKEEGVFLYNQASCLITITFFFSPLYTIGWKISYFLPNFSE